MNPINPNWAPPWTCPRCGDTSWGNQFCAYDTSWGNQFCAYPHAGACERCGVAWDWSGKITWDPRRALARKRRAKR